MCVHCWYKVACVALLCGGVGWRWFGTCITVVIQSAREEVRQEEEKGERESDGERESTREKTREEKREGGCDASLKLGQLHFQSLILTR